MNIKRIRKHLCFLWKMANICFCSHKRRSIK